jgi:hypothetical protein
MRKEVHDDNENVYDSVVARRTRRRKQALIGVAGLAVLGAGAFLVTAQASDNNKTETRDAAALAPVAPVIGSDDVTAAPSASGSVPAPSGAASASAPASAPASASAATTKAQTRKQKIDAVRGTARDNVGKLATRPMRQHAGRVVSDKDLTVVETGSLKKDKATMRVVSARLDLTGQRELSWVTDQGEAFGDAHCTQKIRVREGMPPVEKPTLLLCWRTSAHKSVYTVAVNVTGPPSTAVSVAALDRAWAKLD